MAPYDDAELERLREAGVGEPDDDPTVLVESSRGTPRFWFQAVPEPKTVKNRTHLDLVSDDRAAEIERLVALGASIVDEHLDKEWVTLRDPEGNEFCLFDAAD